ncbi:argininosuccinate lyase, partial [Arachnia propionica]|uniref:argininosuccinate lyase n=1 Tax=Arachnia propionica TaxID=1750 RepID=UPI003C6F98C7
MFELSRSTQFDWRLAPHDIAGSRAHAKALHAAGLLTDDEATAMDAGLAELLRRVRTGEFAPSPTDEDVHGALERGLKEIVGPELGGRLRAGRSRNDQIATLIRSYLREEVRVLVAGVLDVVEALAGQAKKNIGAVMPGRTHLQSAQPVLLSHHLLAHAWPLLRDVSRLQDLDTRLAVSPYGSAALAGTSLGLDPQLVARELGFTSSVPNSIDGTAARDLVAETAWILAQIGVDLSRLSEDVILWCTAELGFAKLADEWSTGSSIMPQKKNPDVAELIRGKTGRVNGNLVALLTVMKGLPLAYNKDMQEDKEGVFDSVSTALASLEILKQMLKTAKFNEQNMLAMTRRGHLTATDLADYLVREKNVPF